MIRALCVAALAASCVPKIEPGPIPTEQAAAPVRLVELPVEASPIVYFQAMIAAGSAFDPVGKEGLAALTASAMAEAGAGEWTAKELKDLLYPTGASLTRVVDRDWVSFRLACHRDHTDICLDVFSAVITAPRFEEADVLRLRGQAEYSVGDGMLANIERLGDEALDAWLFEGHPYGHPVEGRTGVLPLLTPDHARDFYEQHYVREAVLAGLAGGYDEDLRDALMQRLEALAPVQMPDNALQQPIGFEGRHLLFVEAPDASVGFHLGHPLPVSRNHPDWVPLHVALMAFGEHRESYGRLYRAIRTARGLNYGDYAYVEPFTQRGYTSLPENGVLRRQQYFSMWLRPIASDNAAFGLKLAVDELERLVADGLDAEEFDNTVAHLKGTTAVLARNPGRRLAYTLDAEATGTPMLLDWLPEALDGIDNDDVTRALQTHLKPQDLRIVAVGGSAETIHAALLDGTRTPITYTDVEPSTEQAERDSEIATKDLGIDPADAHRVEAKGIFR